ncbi:hypothetical protein COC69_05740 [Bacillus cereus]|uniref:DUF3168 domain-containing protein n=1 Tax=Bacillus cereus TaxID=1396 RepID=A0A9X7CQN6_BACCE|nr:hypothetical protein [Bacillus cereus]PGS81632.1 hypothetical protein COC69_05740 [Bacillus cereus]
MIELMQTLKRLFDDVTIESYLDTNNAESVTYPYLTYSLDIEKIEPNTDGFYLDIDLFDNNSSFVKLYELESQVRDKFDHLIEFTDGLFLRCYFHRSFKVETRDENIKRRSMQIYCKVDWRK